MKGKKFRKANEHNSKHFRTMEPLKSLFKKSLNRYIGKVGLQMPLISRESSNESYFQEKYIPQ